MDLGSFLSAGSSILGGFIGQRASNKAAGQQADGFNNANIVERQERDEAMARNKPFVEGGTNAFNSLLDRLGLSGNTAAPGYNSFGKAPTAEEVMAQPGYQFALNQGQSALERQLNARGHYYSPQAEKSLAKYNQDYATTRYNDEYNRRLADDNNAFARLKDVSAYGQTAANNSNTIGQNFASAYGKNAIGVGSAYANNELRKGQIWQTAASGALESFGGAPKPNTQWV